jgi:hypothetical protein
MADLLAVKRTRLTALRTLRERSDAAGDPPAVAAADREIRTLSAEVIALEASHDA